MAHYLAALSHAACALRMIAYKKLELLLASQVIFTVKETG